MWEKGEHLFPLDALLCLQNASWDSGKDRCPKRCMKGTQQTTLCFPCQTLCHTLICQQCHSVKLPTIPASRRMGSGAVPAPGGKQVPDRWWPWHLWKHLEKPQDCCLPHPPPPPPANSLGAWTCPPHSVSLLWVQAVGNARALTWANCTNICLGTHLPSLKLQVSFFPYSLYFDWKKKTI